MNNTYILTLLVLITSNVFSQNSVFNSIKNSKKIAYFERSKRIIKVDTLSNKENTLLKKAPKEKTELNPGNSFLPVKNYRLTSGYGYRYHPIDKKNKFHYGIDIKTNKSEIYSVIKGTIIKAEYDKHLGYYVKIKHNKICTLYGHLSSINVKVGESVQAGSIIGISGKTGKATGDHLHFAVKYGSQYINPIKLFKLLNIL